MAQRFSGRRMKFWPMVVQLAGKYHWVNWVLIFSDVQWFPYVPSSNGSFPKGTCSGIVVSTWALAIRLLDMGALHWFERKLGKNHPSCSSFRWQVCKKKPWHLRMLMLKFQFWLVKKPTSFVGQHRFPKIPRCFSDLLRQRSWEGRQKQLGWTDLVVLVMGFWSFAKSIYNLY